MDSKMDSGYLGPGQTDVQALEDDYDTTRELAPEQVIGIMDELLCHEVGGTFPESDEYPLMWRYTETNRAMADGMAYGTSTLANTFHLSIP